jgi:8-oxo-dGTP pyrophosphatase MutT (NUDIX family)
MGPLVEPRPAATIILCRPRANEFEVLLVKRHGKSGFMAGAHVFPGGKVDPEDKTWDLPVARLIDDVADAATATGLVVAAIRETFEECGVLLAKHESGLPLSDTAPIDVVVARIHSGESFSEAMKGAGLVPDLDALAPLSWWITPLAEPRRYDTRFFLARVPTWQRAIVDGREVTEGAWLTPKAALDAYRRGTVVLAPPTLATIEDLASFAVIDEAKRAVRRPLRPICPVLHTTDSGVVLALPGDPLHDVKERAFMRRTRIVQRDGKFVSEEG